MPRGVPSGSGRHPGRHYGARDPKLRSGSYFPDWLLEHRKRAERALTTVVATCYLLGVSTRRMEKLVETLGITRLSKSQVSVMAKELDAQVESFRTRPLDAGPYTFIAADALVLKVREGGRVVNVHALLATGVNAGRPWSWSGVVVIREVHSRRCTAEPLRLVHGCVCTPPHHSRRGLGPRGQSDTNARRD